MVTRPSTAFQDSLLLEGVYTMANVTKPRKTPLCFEVDGFRVNNFFVPSRVRSAMNYEPRDDDVFVVTYPKCGTTWMCHIILLILRRGNEPKTPDEYFSVCPFLELNGAEGARDMKRPGCIKMHLPFNRIKFSKSVKYVYVARHPRDCLVSFYHHSRLFPTYYFTDGTFDDFFEVFVRGETEFNDYFDNLLSWYEHRNEPNVFFTTFESMKADHRGTVLKVAEFLGPEHYQAVTGNNGELLEKILELSGFKHMKEVTDPLLMNAFLNAPEDLDSLDEETRRSWENLIKAVEEGQSSVGNFIRKGEVGDSEIVLSDEQERKLAQRILQKTQGSDVMSLWGKR